MRYKQAKGHLKGEADDGELRNIPIALEEECDHGETICDQCAEEWLDDWEIVVLDNAEWVPLQN